jgi:hypothetical protein
VRRVCVGGTLLCDVAFALRFYRPAGNHASIRMLLLAVLEWDGDKAEQQCGG